MPARRSLAALSLAAGATLSCGHSIRLTDASAVNDNSPPEVVMAVRLLGKNGSFVREIDLSHGDATVTIGPYDKFDVIARATDEQSGAQTLVVAWEDSFTCTSNSSQEAENKAGNGVIINQQGIVPGADQQVGAELLGTARLWLYHEVRHECHNDVLSNLQGSLSATATNYHGAKSTSSILTIIVRPIILPNASGVLGPVP